MTEDFDLTAEIVMKLRMGGPNATEITNEAADTIDRLRSALADAEAKLVKARDDALEEAAKTVSYVPSSMFDNPDSYAKGFTFACHRNEVLIRSLKSFTDT